ncbi:toprim domain-containing protein [Candidatus Woesearchaeota archaeon]|nr:toprim domain-containing protein [Candidatus Woesearchaeota archaeon]
MINNLEEWKEKLQNTEKLIIVEGKKDKEALISLGVKRVITINGPLYKFIEDVAEITNEVVILTDFDKEGRQLYGFLKNNFQRNGVKIDRYFREFLMTNTKIICIESIEKTFEKNFTRTIFEE